MFSMLKRAAIAAAVTISLVPVSDFTDIAYADGLPASLQKSGKTDGSAVFAMTGIPAFGSASEKSGKDATDAKTALAERKAESAKRRAEFAEKQVVAYEKLIANMGDDQKAFFEERRAQLAKKAEEAKAEAANLAGHAVVTRSPVKLSGGRYAAIIARHAAANGIPLGLATAVVRVESNFRANARGAAGEIGLMQIKPATARLMGYRGSTKGLYDPETNIKWGMKYLGEAHRLGGGSVCGTILKYNAGHGAKRMNPISRRYCSKVQRYI